MNLALEGLEASGERATGREAVECGWYLLQKIVKERRQALVAIPRLC